MKKFMQHWLKNFLFYIGLVLLPMQQLDETSTYVEKYVVWSIYATYNKDHSTLSSFNTHCFFTNSKFIIFHWLWLTLISSIGSANRDLSRDTLKWGTESVSIYIFEAKKYVVEGGGMLDFVLKVKPRFKSLIKFNIVIHS